MSEQTAATPGTHASAAVKQVPAPPAAVPSGSSGQSRSAAPRRRVLRQAGGLVALGVAAGAGYLAMPSDGRDRPLMFATLGDAMREVDRLHAGSPRSLGPDTAWRWSQVLEHCAQSIEFSLQGFPQPRSALFQRTAGAAAFSVFAWRGRMSHGLDEPIPGAQPLAAPSPDAFAAHARLHAAVKAFAEHPGTLHPHFAYGTLTRAQYEQAHAMHLANHLSVFDLRRMG